MTNHIPDQIARIAADAHYSITVEHVFTDTYVFSLPCSELGRDIKLQVRRIPAAYDNWGKYLPNTLEITDLVEDEDLLLTIDMRDIQRSSTWLPTRTTINLASPHVRIASHVSHRFADLRSEINDLVRAAHKTN